VAADRENFKVELSQTIEKRNAYRDMIIARNDRKKALEDMLAQEKIDVNGLTSAIEGAIEVKVRQDLIERA
jgi:uncharacterized membrane protein